MISTLERPAEPSNSNWILALCCPRCATALDTNDCGRCGFSLRVCNGIVHALPPERIVHYARFIENYETIRAAEGRGGMCLAAYLHLPYKDVSGKHSEQWSIRARSFTHLLSRVLSAHCSSAGSSILDLGAGNCWMSYRLALAGFRPVAVDLIINNYDGLGAAENYRASLPVLFPRLRAEFTRLPLCDGQFDVVIFNSSFHYAEHPELALGEALRVVKRGGIVVVSDTPWYRSEESGHKMVAERRANFLARYGTASDSIQCLEFLTDERLRMLEQHCAIHWERCAPRYGLKWALRPVLAKLRQRREPATFRIYVARKN